MTNYRASEIESPSTRAVWFVLCAAGGTSEESDVRRALVVSRRHHRFEPTNRPPVDQRHEHGIATAFPDRGVADL